MTYRIELTPAAEKALERLSRSDRELLRRVDRAILSLTKEPTPAGSKRLVAQSPPLHRLRVGDYRVIYQIEDDVLMILVIHIGHRKDIYRVLKK